MSLEMWAVAAVAVVDAAGSPLLLRTFTSPPQVLQSPEAPQQAHLYVGPEDIVKVHFLLFASLDRCEEQWQASRQRLQSAAAAKQAASGGGGGGKGSRGASSATSASVAPKRQPHHVSSTSTSGAALPATVAPTGTAAAAPPPPPRLVTSTTDVRFTGKLIQSHRFLSYGFCSATGVKTLLVTVGSEAPQDAVLPICRAIYEAASAALCNPFRTPALSWRARQSLLEKSYHELMAFREKRRADVRGEGDEEADEAPVLSASAMNFRGVRGQQELSWPTPAADIGSQQNAGQQPTLALSETFNNQLNTILSTFTVTTQSCIMH